MKKIFGILVLVLVGCGKAPANVSAGTTSSPNDCIYTEPQGVAQILCNDGTTALMHSITTAGTRFFT